MIFNRDDVASQSTKPKSTTQIVDEEFGVVVCRRSSQARYIKIRVHEDGTVRASLPKRAPLYLVRELLNSSRVEVRKQISQQVDKRVMYYDGMQIGHSHRLHLLTGDVETPKKKLSGQDLTLVFPHDQDMNDTASKEFMSRSVRTALRKEAMAFLPRRLRYLADQYGFRYEKERFGNQRGRWGSCSSTGTISLNVALMNLSFELIDYVLLHELAHTKHMNHSSEFWQLVESCVPNYKEYRKTLKSMSPIC